MEHFLKFIEVFSQKHTLGIFLALVIGYEISKGFLSAFGSYLKTLKLRPSLGIVGAAVLSAAVLLPWDEALIRQAQNIDQPFIDFWIGMGAFLGKAHGIWSVVGCFYAGAMLLRREKWRRFFFGSLISSGLTGLAAHILKFIFARARPYAELGPYHFWDWHGLQHHTRAFQSFPSGDVAITAGAASFIFLAFRKKPLAWLILLAPLGTALSRMSLNKHWPSDTAVSIVLSFAVAKFVWDYVKFKGVRPQRGISGLTPFGQKVPEQN